MLIQINTDANIESSSGLITHVSGLVENALSRVAEHITRVEVHLSDENAHKVGQDDKRCMMEARMEGRQPIAVTHRAESLDQAIDGAVDKLSRLVGDSLDRQRDQKRKRSEPIPPTESSTD